MAGKSNEGVGRVLREALMAGGPCRDDIPARGIQRETAQVLRDWLGDKDPHRMWAAVVVLRTFLDRLERACRNDLDRIEARSRARDLAGKIP